MGLRDKLRRLEGASRANLEHLELVDGSRYYYDPLEVSKAIYLHNVACAKAHSVESWPQPPEVLAKACEARDPAGVLARLAPPGTAFAELPYDQGALVSERRLVPVDHEPVEDLSEP